METANPISQSIMTRSLVLGWSLVLSSFLGAWAGHWARPRFLGPPIHSTSVTQGGSSRSRLGWKLIARGGATGEDDSDEERYSRQVYTLGARAHGLIRSATVYIDGPSTSGLTYEAAKNLALSGIGKIVVLTSDSPHDAHYHLPKWDDLGKTYIRGARAELGMEDDDDDDKISTTEILVEFLHRLNPSLQVEQLPRKNFQKLQGEDVSGILLCVDRPYDTQLDLNKICRELGFPFVAVETAGVHGRVFSDFGPSFDVHDADGETPAVVPLDRVDIDSADDMTILVRAVDGERHDVSKGDEIRFQLSSGDNMENACIVTEVKTPDRILVRPKESVGVNLAGFVEDINAKAASFSRQKQIVQVSFVPLHDATEKALKDPSLFTACDLDKAFDETRKMAVFTAFQSLNNFVQHHKKLPADGDVSLFLEILQDASVPIEKDQEWTDHCYLFASKCAAKFVPIQAIFGAIAAQECLKAASGLYNPIQQFLLYDCDEVISTEGSCTNANVETAESGLDYIMGEDIAEKLRSQKLFVVGAGAIGCELLKNLAAMGAGTGKKGIIVVTDMDTIERSNLSRQLLFRDGDISKFKSKAAEEAVARLNPSVKMETHTSKVGDGEAGPFDSVFWSKKVHVVLNALDNMDARLYMDAQCVANEKALIDAGTLGSKGNVQVVVPHLSESYSSSADPPDPAIPVCTLKNFPYSISHTIQWGRDLFDGLFARRPKQANQYADLVAGQGVESLELTLKQELGEEAFRDVAKELSEDLMLVSTMPQPSVVRQQAIQWAIELARSLFHDSILKLLEEHPLDSVDEDGERFWSGSRKPPTALKFSTDRNLGSQGEIVNQNLLDFVRCAARLRIESVFGPSSDSVISSDEASVALIENRKTEDSTGEGLASLATFSEPKTTLCIAEFEKDDESNGHVAFITAASNLRAMCYGIPPADAMETRRVAGRIVPAMITTTAFVSALSCIELLKLVQGAPLKRYRNAFINLALPFFAFTVPLPAEKVEGLRGQTYTLWDRITVKETQKSVANGGLTMRRLLKQLKKKSTEDSGTIEIASISYGQYMIYANFLNEGDDEFLDKHLWTVVQEAVTSGDKFDNSFMREGDANSSTGAHIIDDVALDLTVVVEDTETGEEVELPPVRVLRSTKPH